MKTSDFYYDLPKELIAQSPAECRSASRLLVYNRATKSIEDKVFSDIIDYLDPGDVLVRNTTRVIPARLYGIRPETGGKMEFCCFAESMKTLGMPCETRKTCKSWVDVQNQR